MCIILTFAVLGVSKVTKRWPKVMSAHRQTLKHKAENHQVQFMDIVLNTAWCTSKS
jgi:hypothetical protein